MKTCPNCKTSTLDDCINCPNCGASFGPELQRHVYCPHCARWTPPDKKYCTLCRASLSSAVASPSALPLVRQGGYYVGLFVCPFCHEQGVMSSVNGNRCCPKCDARLPKPTIVSDAPECPDCHCCARLHLANKLRVCSSCYAPRKTLADIPGDLWDSISAYGCTQEYQLALRHSIPSLFVCRFPGEFFRSDKSLIPGIGIGTRGPSNNYSFGPPVKLNVDNVYRAMFLSNGLLAVCSKATLFANDFYLQCWDFDSKSPVESWKDRWLPQKLIHVKTPIPVTGVLLAQMSFTGDVLCYGPCNTMFFSTIGANCWAVSPTCSRAIYNTGGVGIVIYSPDNKLLATLPFPSPPPPPGHRISNLAFSPDGNLLASGDEDGNVIIWNINTKNILSQICLKEMVLFLEVLPNCCVEIITPNLFSIWDWKENIVFNIIGRRKIMRCTNNESEPATTLFETSSNFTAFTRLLNGDLLVLEEDGTITLLSSLLPGIQHRFEVKIFNEPRLDVHLMPRFLLSADGRVALITQADNAGWRTVWVLTKDLNKRLSKGYAHKNQNCSIM